jgi:Holliday junction resolvase RusA-like endonuclease
MTAAQLPLAIPVSPRLLAALREAERETLSFFVPGEPRRWQRPVTIIQNGKRRTFTPDETIDYELLVRTHALRAMKLAHWAEPGPEDRFALQLLIHLGTARRRDCSNILKAVEDGLQPARGQKGGTPILDDWQICSLSVRRVVRSARPGVRVVLSRTEETVGLEGAP